MPVHIGDVNDNAPKMEQKVIRANLRENIAVGSKLLSVRATDADHPAGYGKLVFEIDGGDGVFGINSTTGQMILTDELDYETKTAYQVRPKSYLHPFVSHFALVTSLISCTKKPLLAY